MTAVRDYVLVDHRPVEIPQSHAHYAVTVHYDNYPYTRTFGPADRGTLAGIVSKVMANRDGSIVGWDVLTLQPWENFD